MKKKAFIFAGVIIAAFAAAAQQGVTLRRDLKEDSTDVYKVTVDTKSVGTAAGMDFDLNIGTTLKVTVKTGKKDATTGQLGFDATSTDVESKVDGSAAQYVQPMIDTLPKEMKASGKVDAMNKLSIKDEKSNPAGMMTHSSPTSVLTTYLEFPDKSVNVGDTWTVQIINNPYYGKKTQTLTAKLTGERDLDGVKVWVVNLSGKLNIDADPSALGGEAAGGATSIKGTSDLDGEALIDKTSGKTLVYTVTTKDNTSMDTGQFTVETKGTTKVTSTLQK